MASEGFCFFGSLLMLMLKTCSTDLVVGSCNSVNSASGGALAGKGMRRFCFPTARIAYRFCWAQCFLFKSIPLPLCPIEIQILTNLVS